MPLNTPDFSSFLLQAKNSGATTIALALAGADLTNAIKQANEFRVADGGQNLAGMLSFISDVNAMGLSVAQGIVTSESVLCNGAGASWRSYRARCPIWFTPEPILRFCITSAVSLLPERSTPPSS